MSENTPFINKTSRNTMDLDASVVSDKNGSGVSGKLQTMFGDMIISTENTQNLFVNTNVCTNVVLDSLPQLPLSFPSFTHNFVFMSSETVELEIEIRNMLSDLQNLELPSSSSESSFRQTTNQEVFISQTPFHSLFSPQASQNTSSKIPISSHSTNSSIFSTEHGELSSYNKIFGNSLDHREKKDIDLNDKSKTNNVVEKYIQEAKSEITSSSSKHKHEDKDKKNQDKNSGQQHEREQQNHKHREQENKTFEKKKEIKKIDRQNLQVESISLEALKYRDSLNQFEKAEKTSPCLRKKLDSPLKVFKATCSDKTQARNAPPKIENIFIKFMQLMAKILGQAEAEAHDLYLKIKERTDNVDLLTLLLSKVNSEKEDINWEDNEEMKFLVNRARECGVDIPPEKYTWTEEEKKLLKENIQMQKDSMEKITQLERTDMQRYLQEVSQCHQTRSNVLKLLKEVIDTFIYNLRP